VTLSEPNLANGFVYWIEGRPSEGGRQVIVRARVDGTERTDLIHEGFSARTRVHEYGGGAYELLPDGGVVFSNDADWRAYAVAAAGDPRPLTPEPDAPRALRYADFAVAGDRIVCVRETHSDSGEPVNAIVSITDGEVLAGGHDFYAAPRISPDGKQLA
jgi:hypothetical protein